MNPSRIIDLWYEPGTIYDAAQAVYHASGRRKWIAPERIQKIWAKAQEDGRLPPLSLIKRPPNGFAKNQSDILKRFMMVEREKRAA